MLHGLKRRLKKFISKFYDPLVTISIGNQKIKIPLSHDLTDILRLYPEYNFNLARIVKYANAQIPDLRVIDIGANIGDTVAFIKNYSDVPILCIDGDERYMRVLKENTVKFKNVFSCKTLVGAETKEVNLKLRSEKGTAYIEESADAVSMRSLVNILEDFPDFKKSKIIKSDTDGFDTIILRSCSEYLKSVRPILFFEFDPHLIKRNNDDAFEFMTFLEDHGYRYFIFYVNIGDYLVSCMSDQKEILAQLIHYFSGRKLDLFADVCAFTEDDRTLFEEITDQEIRHYRQIRNY